MQAALEKQESEQDQVVYFYVNAVTFQDETGWTAVDPRLRLEGYGSTKDDAMSDLVRRAKEVIGSRETKDAKREFLEQRKVDHRYKNPDGTESFFAQIVISVNIPVPEESAGQDC